MGQTMTKPTKKPAKKPKKPGPPEHSPEAIQAHPAPVREDFKTGMGYAKACRKVSEARIAFDAPSQAGTSKEAKEAREQAFAYAYVSNGHNGTQAAIAAGCPVAGAHVAAARMLKVAKVQEIITAATKKAAGIAGLEVDRTLREVARLAYSDPRKFYDEKGNLKPIHMLDDDSAACIAGIEVDEIKVGDVVIGQTKKYKHWDKKGALDMAMKHHGQYKQDNEQQKGDSLALMVVFGK